MQDTPHLVSPLGQSTMIVLHGRQRAVAPFDSRRRTLKGVDPVSRPRLPIFQDLRGQPLGDPVRGTLGADGLQGLHNLGLSSSTTRMGGLVFPRDKRQQGLLNPPPPETRQGAWLHIAADALPPPVDQGCQGRSRCADFAPGTRTCRHVRALREGFDGIDSRLSAAGDLR